MSTPSEKTTTMRVRVETHGRIMRMAADAGGTADDVLRMLLAPTTIHVPLGAVQHKRWTKAARERGINLAQLVKNSVENIISSTDATMLERMYYLTRAIGNHLGVGPGDGVQTTTEDAPE